MYRSRVNIEVEVVDGNDAAKGSHQIANLENRLSLASLVCLVSANRTVRVMSTMPVTFNT